MNLLMGAHDLSSDPLVTKLSLQADLNQRKEGGQVPFQPLLGSCCGLGHKCIISDRDPAQRG